MNQALSKCNSVADTRIDMSEFGRFEIADSEENGTEIALHIVGFAPDESAGTVDMLLSGKKDSLKAAKPPKNRAFHNGAFMMLIRGNNVYCCGDGIRAAGAESYLRQLFGKLNLDPESQAFELMPVANAKKLQILQSEGVSEIDLDATLYAATIDASKEQLPLAGALQKLLQGLRDELAAYVSSDLEQSYIDQLAELQVKVSIKPKGGKRGALLPQQVIEAAGTDILRKDEEGKQHEEIGFTLVTGKGNRVTANDATIGRSHPFARKIGQNVLDHLAVWPELRAFADQLQKSGIAGQ